MWPSGALSISALVAMLVPPPGLVLDDDRLAERGLQLLADGAGDDVHGSAGAVADDDVDRFAREGLGARSAPGSKRQGGENGLTAGEGVIVVSWNG